MISLRLGGPKGSPRFICIFMTETGSHKCSHIPYFREVYFVINNSTTFKWPYGIKVASGRYSLSSDDHLHHFGREADSQKKVIIAKCVGVLNHGQLDFLFNGYVGNSDKTLTKGTVQRKVSMSWHHYIQTFTDTFLVKWNWIKELLQ